MSATEATAAEQRRLTDERLGMQVIRWTLLVAIAVGSAYGVFTSQRPASAEDYREALASGEVASVTLGLAGERFVQLHLNLSGTAPDGDDLAAWTTGPWPWQRFATDDLRSNTARLLAEEAGVPVTYQGTDWVLLVMAGAYLLVIGTVVFGPQPRRFTRWAAFWWVTLPLGGGVLWLLVREAPWSQTASAMPEPLPHGKQRLTAEGDPRFTGGVAFLVTLLAGTVAEVVGPYVWA